MEKIRDLTLLSDVLPTAFHGFAGPDWPAAPAYVVGENILIFGAGPVGRAGAACARLLGAGAIIVADYIQERLDLLKPHGVETINLSDGVPIEEHRTHYRAQGGGSRHRLCWCGLPRVWRGG